MTVRKYILTMLIIFSVVPVLFLTISSLASTIATIEDLQISRLDSIARTAASSFDEIIGFYEASVEQLASNDRVMNYILNRESLGDDSSAAQTSRAAVVRYFSSYVDTLPAMSDIILLDENGSSLVWHLKDSEIRSFADSDFFARHLQNNDPDYIFTGDVTDSLEFPGNQDYKCIPISRAIRASDGKLLGVMVSFLKINTLTDFSRSISFGETGLSFIIDSKNYILYHPDPMYNSNHTVAPKLENLFSRWTDGLIPETGSIRDEALGKERIYYYVIIKDTAFVLLLRQDYSEFTEDRRSFLIMSSIIIAVVLGLAVFFGSRLARKFTKPIIALQKAFASGSGKGKYVRCDLREKNELGDMARSYNIMIGALEEQYNLAQKEKSKNEYMAYHDSITGLSNRSAFEAEISGYIRAGEKFSVFLIDMDNFKQINDIFGHMMGDELLRVFGKTLAASKARFDICARAGGDEFYVAKLGQPEEMQRVAQQIHQELQEPFSVSGNTLFITSSIGVAGYPKDGSSVNELMDNADISMYKAKNMGRNVICFFSDEMRATIERHNQVLQVLRSCVENGDVFLQYQPEVATEDKRILAFEALMRIQNSSLGPISPGEFIPIAESDSSIITQLGYWAMREACLFTKRMIAAYGYEGVISVNVSAVQLMQDDFVRRVRAIIKETGLPPKRLQLEITESMMIDDMHNSIRKLTQLRSSGISIAMDDFGTHFSSFNYLIHLPIDMLKIDKSFIDEIVSNDNMLFINQTIIDVAHKLKMKVIAEGVETQEQWDVLSKLGCDIIQGYKYSKPLSEADAVLKLKE